MDKSITVSCPTCRKMGQWFMAASGPFCSQRCQLVDLGKWFDQEMVITDPLRPDLFSGYGDLPPGQYLDDPNQDPANL